MALHFTPANTPLRGLEMWQADSTEYSFAINQECRQETALAGKGRICRLVAISLQQQSRYRCGRFTLCDAD
jgi:hypothetical protein